MIAMPNLDFVVAPNLKGQAVVCWNRFVNDQFNLYACNLLPDGTNCSDRYDDINPVVSDNKNFNIFPNPFNQQINIVIPYSENNNSKFSLKIYDVNCKLVLNQELTNASARQINTAFLSKGLYYYNIISNNSIMNKGMLIKE